MTERLDVGLWTRLNPAQRDILRVAYRYDRQEQQGVRLCTRDEAKALANKVMRQLPDRITSTNPKEQA